MLAQIRSLTDLAIKMSKIRGKNGLAIVVLRNCIGVRFAGTDAALASHPSSLSGAGAITWAVDLCCIPSQLHPGSK